MSTESLLLVIGIAIAANLIIMGLLVMTLLVRRRGRLATHDEIEAPAAYRLSGIAAPPSAVAPAAGLFIDDERTRPASEDTDQAVNSTDLTDFRRFRPVMTDEGPRGDAAIASFFSPGSSSPEPAPLARDAQTGLDGPLNWEFRVRDEDARLIRYRRPCSVVLVELDGLDRLIARFGADAADRIIPPVGQTLQRQARTSDHVARIAEGRFAVLLPETDEIQAINYVERVRSECDRWLAAGAVSMRLSIGWACPAPGSDLRTATRVAEDRLNADRRRLPLTPETGPGTGAPERTGPESYPAAAAGGTDMTLPLERDVSD
jgi:diguanylate cyclase (GGDEF)-like protein